MIFAKDESGERIEPWPGAKAECPTCGEEVIAKCGSTNRWHWSHRGDTNCDPWSEHEGPWHLAWKDYFAPSEREIVIGPHRADVRTKAGRVIELQHSPISAEEIREREEFYGRGMVWVIDASVFWENVNFVFYPSNWEKFQWRWPRKCWTAAIRPLYFDAGGDRLFRVQEFDANARYGYGNWGCKYEWLRFFGSRATLNKDPIERLHAMHERGAYASR
jgi:competence CoiA-like predicted nuclease